MPQIKGNIPNTTRFVTGIYQFDDAFRLNNNPNRFGIPIGCGWEVFGANHVGKSTFTYCLLGMISAFYKRDWGLVDLEGFDPGYLNLLTSNMGMTSEQIIHVIQGQEKGESVSDSSLADELAEMLNDDVFPFGMVDSLGAWMSTAEEQGASDEAHMGRRAKEVASFSRRIIKFLRNSDIGTVFLINHWYPQMATQGWDTPGGNVKKYIANVRVLLRNRQPKNSYNFPDGSYVLQGEVYKNRFGGVTQADRKKFSIFMLADYGIHVGLSNLFACFDLGLVSRKGMTVKSTGEKLDKLPKWIKKYKEMDFSIFSELLENHYKTTDEMIKELGY